MKGCSGKLDVALVIDSSGSIRNERFPYVLDFLTNIVDQFHLEKDGGETRLGAIYFSDRSVYLCMHIGSNFIPRGFNVDINFYVIYFQV